MKKLFLLIPLLLLFVFASGCGASGGDDLLYRQVSGEEAMEMMQTESGYLIVDVRTAQEYAAGHLPNAVNIPNESIGKEMPPQLPDTEQLIFVYCRSGRRSKEAAQKLADMGYLNIVEMGGINDWPGEITKE